MSRRQRLPSWVEDTPTPKPVKPLRYRIDPTAEKSDQLDAMLAELERQAHTMEVGDYWDLRGLITGQQEALAKRAAKLKGTVKVSIDSSYSTPTVSHADRARWLWHDYVTQLGYKWCVGLFVVIWLISKNI